MFKFKRPSGKRYDAYIDSTIKKLDKMYGTYTPMPEEPEPIYASRILAKKIHDTYLAQNPGASETEAMLAVTAMRKGYDATMLPEVVWSNLQKVMSSSPITLPDLFAVTQNKYTPGPDKTEQVLDESLKATANLVSDAERLSRVASLQKPDVAKYIDPVNWTFTDSIDPNAPGKLHPFVQEVIGKYPELLERPDLLEYLYRKHTDPKAMKANFPDNSIEDAKNKQLYLRIGPDTIKLLKDVTSSHSGNIKRDIETVIENLQQQIKSGAPTTANAKTRFDNGVKRMGAYKKLLTQYKKK